MHFFEGIRFNFRKLFHMPLKVGFITYGYPSDKKHATSGIDIYSYYVSRGLANLGAEVHVFCSGNKSSVKTEYIGEGKLIVHRLETKMNVGLKEKATELYLSNFIFNNKVVEEITRENKKEKFDLINSNGGLISGVFIAKYFNNIRWIHTSHSLEKNVIKFMSPEKKKLINVFDWVESSLYHADGILAVSSKLKEEILKDYNVNENKVFFIPNGVDTTVFNSNNSKREKKISYVGRFAYEKGEDFIPKIAREVLSKDSEVKFEAVAPDKNDNLPESSKEVLREMEKLKEDFPERFIWHREGLSRPEIAEIFRSSMISIQPSRYESFGMTVLEAMACGSVPVVSNRGGLPEVVGNAGVVVPLGSKVFVRNILKFLKDYGLWERYHRRAVSRAKSFDWENIVKRTYDLFKVIAKRREEDSESSEKVAHALDNIEKSAEVSGEKEKSDKKINKRKVFRRNQKP